jgi:hypothetical protein
MGTQVAGHHHLAGAAKQHEFHVEQACAGRRVLEVLRDRDRKPMLR